MQFSSGSLLLLFILSFDFCLATKSSPFVILPYFFRANATNSITVTPVKDSDANQSVDIDFYVFKSNESLRDSIFSQKLKAKQSGAPQTIKFPLGLSIDSLTVRIAIERHETFKATIPVKQDISTIHIHTDKAIYRAGEKIDVRILPLTYSNTIYNGPIEVTLVNPDEYELFRKVITATDSYAATSFELPEHLYFGTWRIYVRPESDRESNSFDTSFTVEEYVLPPFKISAFIQDGDPLDRTRISIDAKYYYGGTVNGSLVLSCTQSKDDKLVNSVATTVQIRQSQVRLFHLKS
ncbi:unnamed protein product [Auanema sp. JU1783]|nr:unnamed protein product [Auanema sp. JU1783]